MSSEVILIVVIVTAVAFDFTNGFHDTATAVATSISTRALPPRLAVLGAALLNFAGASAVSASGLFDKLIFPAVVAPVVAFLIAGALIVIIYRLVGRMRPGPVSRSFRVAQLASGGALALSHGTNDAQKTMGVITLALVANGNISASHFYVPLWVVVLAASAIGLGTFTGGWRIIKTMGSRIIKMDPAQGFAAQGAGAGVILAASAVGYPLSTTHVISGAVMGAGAAKRVSAVRWGVAGDIVRAWLLTFPAAAALSAAVYGLESLFGSGAAGTLVIGFVLLFVVALLFVKRLQQPASAPSPSRA